MHAHRFSIFKKLFVALVFASLELTTWAATGDFQKDFERANQQYDLGKFAAAETLYSSIVNDGHYSPEVFYNLGNTEFRLKKSGEAILNYERALALSPDQPEAQANLTYVREQTGAKIAPEDWQNRIIAGFDSEGYGMLAVCAAWVGIFSLAVILMKFWPGNLLPWLVGICAIAVAGYACFAIYHLEQDRTLAIVTANSTEARFAPADNSALAAALPEGSRVWILERHGPWIYCVLPDNGRAWISADSIQRVRLHAS